MLQTLTFNGQRIINAAASFFRYESGSAGGADESIKLRADGQDLGIYYPGDSVELPDQRGMWEITPASAACAGTVRLGVGRVQSARLVGTVQIIDGERNKVMAGVCFRGVVQSGSINAATAELWNPAGSAKNLFVQAVRGGASVADAWGIVTTDFQLVNAGPATSNLDRNGQASVALMRWGDATTMTNQKGHAAGYIAASSDVVVVMPRPILVRPGTGIAFYLNAAANVARATFEWEEWPI